MQPYLSRSPLLRLPLVQPLPLDILLAPDISTIKKGCLRTGQIRFREAGQIRFPFWARRSILCLIILVATSIFPVSAKAAQTTVYLHAENSSGHTVYLEEQVNGLTWTIVGTPGYYGASPVNTSREHDFQDSTVIYFLWDSTISQVLPGTLQASGNGETLNFTYEGYVEPPCTTNLSHYLINNTGHKADVFTMVYNGYGLLWSSQTWSAVNNGWQVSVTTTDGCEMGSWIWYDDIIIRYDLDITNVTRCVQNIYQTPAEIYWYDGYVNSQTDYGVLSGGWSCHNWVGTMGDFADMNIQSEVRALDGVFNADTNGDFTYSMISNTSFYGFNLASGTGTNLTGDMGFGSIHTSNTIGRIIWETNTLSGEGLATEATLRSGFTLEIGTQKEGNLVLNSILKKIENNKQSNVMTLALTLTNKFYVTTNFNVAYYTNIFNMVLTNAGMGSNDFMKAYGSLSLDLSGHFTNELGKLLENDRTNDLTLAEREQLRTNAFLLTTSFTNFANQGLLSFASETNLLGRQHLDTLFGMSNAAFMVITAINAVTNWFVNTNSMYFVVTNSLTPDFGLSNGIAGIALELDEMGSNLVSQTAGQSNFFSKMYDAMENTNYLGTFREGTIEGDTDMTWLDELIGAIPAEVRLGSPMSTAGMIVAVGGRTFTFHVNPFERGWVIELAALVRGVITWSIYLGGFFLVIKTLQQTVTSTAAVGKVLWGASITRAAVPVEAAAAASRLVVLAAVSLAFIAIVVLAKNFLMGYVTFVYINPWLASLSGNLSSGLWMADQFLPLSLMIVFPLTLLAFNVAFLKITIIKLAWIRVLTAS